MPFIKSYSAELNKEIKLNTDTGAVIVNEYRKFGDTSKLVKYSKSECDIIKATIGKISLAVHLVKTTFDGEIVKK